jgi:hypothetical protein
MISWESVRYCHADLRYRARGTISRPANDIAHTHDIVSAGGDIRSRPTISRVALTITRVGTIPRPGHDIVRKRTILQRGPAISRAPTISRPAHDIAHTHDNTIAARYRTRVAISWAGSRYRAGTISWARPRYRGISRYRAPAQDNARSRKVLWMLMIWMRSSWMRCTPLGISYVRSRRFGNLQARCMAQP